MKLNTIEQIFLKLDNPDRFFLIDYLRALAVITVVLTHFDIIDLYGVGTDLFFVVSGVLVSRPFLRDFYNSNSTNIKGFYIRRAFKILPSYYFFLFATYLLFAFFPCVNNESLTFKLSELPQYLFFYRNYAGPPPRWAFEHTWSLCVEEHFYLFMPLAFLLLGYFKNFSQKLLLPIIAGLLFIAITIKVLFNIYSFAEYPTSTHNRLDTFLWGILINIILLKHQEVYKLVQNNKWVLIIGLILIFLPLFFRSPNDVHEIYIRCLSPIGITLIVLSFFEYRNSKLKILQLISFFSYNLYLWHQPIAKFVICKIGYNFWGGVTYFVASISVAIITTLLIETTFISVRERFFSK